MQGPGLAGLLEGSEGFIKAELARQIERRRVIPVEGRALFRAPESLMGIVCLGDNEGYESRRDN